MLVSGPVGISVTGPGAASSVARRNASAPSGRTSERGSGRSAPSSPLSPWTSSAISSGRASGAAAPAATGTSVRPSSARTRSVLRVVSRRPTLPPTVVMPSTSSSGPGERERDREGVVVAGVAVQQDGDRARLRQAPERVDEQCREPLAVDDDADVRVGRPAVAPQPVRLAVADRPAAGRPVGGVEGHVVRARRRRGPGSPGARSPRRRGSPSPTSPTIAGCDRARSP